MREKHGQPQVRREVQELSLLFEMSRILDRSLDLREVVHPVLKAMADHMGMLRGSLTLLNRDTGEISVEAAYGLSPSQKERGRCGSLAKPALAMTLSTVRMASSTASSFNNWTISPADSRWPRKT